MDNTTLIQDLQPIFADVLDQPDLLVTSESSPSNVEGWDSLAQINLLAAIEKRYRIRFSLGELQDLNSVGDITELIRRKAQQ
jgi:acyl carrier protein